MPLRMRPVGEMLVRYSAEQMPVEAIEEIQAQTVKDLSTGEIALGDGLRVMSLLLTIALQKLQATP